MSAPVPYVLVTYIVSHDGEPLRPMTESVARVDVDTAGAPVPEALAELTERLAAAITDKATRPSGTSEVTDGRP